MSENGGSKSRVLKIAGVVVAVLVLVAAAVFLITSV